MFLIFHVFISIVIFEVVTISWFDDTYGRLSFGHFALLVISMQIEARICDENKNYSRKYGDPNVKSRFISKNISYKFHKLAHEFLKWN